MKQKNLDATARAYRLFAFFLLSIVFGTGTLICFFSHYALFFFLPFACFLLCISEAVSAITFDD